RAGELHDRDHRADHDHAEDAAERRPEPLGHAPGVLHRVVIDLLHDWDLPRTRVGCTRYSRSLSRNHWGFSYDVETLPPLPGTRGPTVFTFEVADLERATKSRSLRHRGRGPQRIRASRHSRARWPSAPALRRSASSSAAGALPAHGSARGSRSPSRRAARAAADRASATATAAPSGSWRRSPRSVDRSRSPARRDRRAVTAA